MDFSNAILQTGTILTQVTTLTEMQTRLTSVQTQLESFTTNLKEEFESLTGAAATENQILSGSTVDEDKDHASKTYLMALQSLMVTRQTIMQVTTFHLVGFLSFPFFRLRTSLLFSLLREAFPTVKKYQGTSSSTDCSLSS